MFLNEWLKRSAGLILIILRLGMNSTLPELHCRLDQNLLTEFSARVARNRVTDWGWGSVSPFDGFRMTACVFERMVEKICGTNSHNSPSRYAFNSSGATL